MIRLILALLLILGVFGAGITLAQINAQIIHFDYLFGSAELGLVSLLLIAFAAGVMLTLLVGGLRVALLYAELRKLRRQLRSNSAELRSLRSLPVDSSPASPGIRNGTL